MKSAGTTTTPSACAVELEAADPLRELKSADPALLKRLMALSNTAFRDWLQARGLRLDCCPPARQRNDPSGMRASSAAFQILFWLERDPFLRPKHVSPLVWCVVRF